MTEQYRGGEPRVAARQRRGRERGQFAELLRRYRRAADLRQVDVARAVQVAKSTYSHWENGYNLPRDPEVFRRLSALLQVPQQQLAAAAGYIEPVAAAAERSAEATVLAEVAIQAIAERVRQLLGRQSGTLLRPPERGNGRGGADGGMRPVSDERAEEAGDPGPQAGR